MYYEFKVGDTVKINLKGLQVSYCHYLYEKNNFFIVNERNYNHLGVNIIGITNINKNTCKCNSCSQYMKEISIHVSHLELLKTKLEIERFIKLKEFLIDG